MLSRHRGDALDRRPRVFAVLALGFGIMLGGLIAASSPYGTVPFVIELFVAELVLAAALLVAIAVGFPDARLGLCMPRLVSAWRVLPLALTLAVAIGAWLVARASLPAGVPADTATSLQVLRTTSLVGFNEELLFRGLALAAFWHWWGPRRGAIAAMLAFGSFHLLNVAAGSPPAGVAVQFVFTAVFGAAFVQAAVGTRTLWFPIVAHAIYDAALFDLARFQAAGGDGTPLLAVTVTAIACGLAALAMVPSLHGREPFPR